MPTHSTGLCANLPIATVSLHAFWCQHHQAWTTSATIYTEDGTQEPRVYAQCGQEFGPFDDGEDVAAWMTEQAREFMRVALSPGHREPGATDVIAGYRPAVQDLLARMAADDEPEEPTLW